MFYWYEIQLSIIQEKNETKYLQTNLYRIEVVRELLWLEGKTEEKTTIIKRNCFNAKSYELVVWTVGYGYLPPPSAICLLDIDWNLRGWNRI